MAGSGSDSDEVERPRLEVPTTGRKRVSKPKENYDHSIWTKIPIQRKTVKETTDTPQEPASSDESTEESVKKILKKKAQKQTKKRQVGGTDSDGAHDEPGEAAHARQSMKKQKTASNQGAKEGKRQQKTKSAQTGQQEVITIDGNDTDGEIVEVGQRQTEKKAKKAATEEDRLQQLLTIDKSSTLKDSREVLKSSTKVYLLAFFRRDFSDPAFRVEDHASYKCRHCKFAKDLNAASKYNTRGFKDHLKSEHTLLHALCEYFVTTDTLPGIEACLILRNERAFSQDDVKALIPKLKIQTNLEASFAASVPPGTVMLQSDLESLLVKMCSWGALSFTVVENPFFRDIISILAGKHGLRMISAKTVARRVSDTAEASIDRLKADIKSSASKVALALDAWTSPNQHPYLAITVHFIDESFNIRHELAAFEYVPGSHTGVRLAEAVLAVVASYDIRHKISAIVCDNASNNATMMTALQTGLSKEGNFEFDAMSSRVRCMAHILHLVVSELLACLGVAKATTEDGKGYQANVSETSESAEEEEEPEEEEEARLVDVEPADTTDFGMDSDVEIPKVIQTIRKINRRIRKSPLQRKVYLECIMECANDGKLVMNATAPSGWAPILDVRTRWNSTFLMLQRAVRHHEAFDRYCIRQHRKFDVTEAEWNTMAGLCEWLKPFYLCTQQMSSSNVVTLSSTFIWFFDINDHLLKMKSSPSAASSERIRKGLERAQKKLLLYLDMCNKSPLYVWACNPRAKLRLLNAIGEKDSSFRFAVHRHKSALEEHFAAKYDRPRSPVPSAAIDEPDTPMGIAGIASRLASSSVSSEDDLQSYLAAPLAPPTEDPIAWWEKNEGVYPRLSLLARDVLGIPGSSVEVERVFSHGRDVITYRRHNLGVDRIRDLVILKMQLAQEAERLKQKHKRWVEVIA